MVTHKLVRVDIFIKRDSVISLTQFDCKISWISPVCTVQLKNKLEKATPNVLTLQNLPDRRKETSPAS